MVIVGEEEAQEALIEDIQEIRARRERLKKRGRARRRETKKKKETRRRQKWKKVKVVVVVTEGRRRRRTREERAVVLMWKAKDERMLTLISITGSILETSWVEIQTLRSICRERRKKTKRSLSCRTTTRLDITDAVEDTPQLVLSLRGVSSFRHPTPQIASTLAKTAKRRKKTTTQVLMPGMLT